MDYLFQVLIFVGIYYILALSLNLLVGYAGLMPICHGAVFGVGAYSAAILSVGYGWPVVASTAVGVVAGGGVGVLLGLLATRVADDYFVISTLALQVIFVRVVKNWVSVTGGTPGLQGIPVPSLFGYQFSSELLFFALVVVICLIVGVVARRLVNSPYGRVLESLREDEIFAQASGKSVLNAKLSVFLVSGAMAAVAGTLYAHYVRFIDPSTFGLSESIFILSLVIIGGAGSQWGPLAGAVVLLTVPEVLRFVGMPNAIEGNLSQIIYGCLLVTFVIWRPTGLVGRVDLRVSRANYE